MQRKFKSPQIITVSIKKSFFNKNQQKVLLVSTLHLFFINKKSCWCQRYISPSSTKGLAGINATSFLHPQKVLLVSTSLLHKFGWCFK